MARDRGDIFLANCEVHGANEVLLFEDDVQHGLDRTFRGLAHYAADSSALKRPVRATYSDLHRIPRGIRSQVVPISMIREDVFHDQVPRLDISQSLKEGIVIPHIRPRRK